MANRRARIHEFYDRPRTVIGGVPGYSITEKTASAASRYQFRGAQFEKTIVVRCDLNGYSSWARDRGITDRVRLLNEFFSVVVPLLASHGGIYFRDEGDCIVAVFSGYFQLGATFDSARKFCQAVVSRKYGADQLTAKAVVAYDSVAYFQKQHEMGTDDWSAEGHPFVAAARLEQAVESKQRVTFFKADYDEFFAANVTLVPLGSPVPWTYTEGKLRVEGMGFVSGWTDIVTLEYVG